MDDSLKGILHQLYERDTELETTIKQINDVISGAEENVDSCINDINRSCDTMIGKIENMRKILILKAKNKHKEQEMRIKNTLNCIQEKQNISKLTIKECQQYSDKSNLSSPYKLIKLKQIIIANDFNQKCKIDGQTLNSIQQFTEYQIYLHLDQYYKLESIMDIKYGINNNLRNNKPFSMNIRNQYNDIIVRIPIDMKWQIIIDHWTRILSITFLVDVVQIITNYGDCDVYDTFDNKLYDGNKYLNHDGSSVKSKNIYAQQTDGWSFGFGEVETKWNQYYEWNLQILNGFGHMVIGIIDCKQCIKYYIDQWGDNLNWCLDGIGYGYSSKGKLLHNDIKYTQNIPKYRKGDIVKICLDLKQYKLKFAKNNKQFGFKFNVKKNISYKLIIAVYNTKKYQYCIKLCDSRL